MVKDSAGISLTVSDPADSLGFNSVTMPYLMSPKHLLTSSFPVVVILSGLVHLQPGRVEAFQTDVGGDPGPGVGGKLPQCVAYSMIWCVQG